MRKKLDPFITTYLIIDFISICLFIYFMTKRG